MAPHQRKCARYQFPTNDHRSSQVLQPCQHPSLLAILHRLRLLHGWSRFSMQLPISDPNPIACLFRHVLPNPFDPRHRAPLVQLLQGLTGKTSTYIQAPVCLSTWIKNLWNPGVYNPLSLFVWYVIYVYIPIFDRNPWSTIRFIPEDILWKPLTIYVHKTVKVWPQPRPVSMASKLRDV